MSKTRLVITAVVVEGRSQGEVARCYGVSKGWVSRLVARDRAEGETAFEPRSRRPRTSPTAIGAGCVERIVAIRQELTGKGLDAGPDTIAWHLRQRYRLTVSVATISRYLVRAGLVTPDPSKRPKPSYVRYAAEQPNETWQADFTHYRLATGADTEVLSWLDDHSRYALRVTAHDRVSAPIVLAAFRAAVATHGTPASTLTDNGMENELARLHVRQKNSPRRTTPPPAERSNGSSRR